MDTLFRLVNDLESSDQYSYNKSSSSSKNSSDQNHCSYLQNPRSQECFNNLFMEEEDHFSASSSSNHHHHLQQFPCSTTTASTTSTVYVSGSATSLGDLNFEFSKEWASAILLQTAIAIIDNNTNRIQQLMWMLNELGSPYGDIDQKLAFYFLQAMFSRITDSGAKCYQTLTAASEKRCCFKSMRRMVLKFEEMSPWMTFGHVASNGSIMEAVQGEKKLHIIDIAGNSSFCTQWPTFIEALATHSDQTPHLTLTTLVAAKSEGTIVAHKKLMREISRRLEKFARLMGVSFKFKPIFHSGDVSHFDFTHLGVKHDEAVAVNCAGALHSVSPLHNRRDFLISLFRTLRPRIITVVEEEADLNTHGDVDFVKHLQECLRWFRLYFDSLDGSFPIASDEQLMLERAAGRAVVDLLARVPAESVERRETAGSWARRLYDGGFKPVSFSEDVSDDVRALLKRYKDGWTVTDVDGKGTGIFLAWKGQPVVWAAAWAPGQPDRDKSLVSQMAFARVPEKCII